MNNPLDGGLLFFLHCGSNTGYAIAPLERIFFRAGLGVVANPERLHFTYPSLSNGRPDTLPDEFGNVEKFDPTDGSPANRRWIESYVRRHGIKWAVGFDQPVHRPVYRAMRNGGVRKIISYWGAPMSDLNHGLKLLLKKMEVALYRHKPDHFIFESHAMADSATRGRGIHPDRVSVSCLGVDTGKFHPVAELSDYAYRAFDIPRDRKIFFYSGHMEERKGVQVIVRAAVELVTKRQRHDVHFLITGNRNGEERRFDSLYKGTAAESHITFGGYRGDLPEIHRSCHAGVIASVGWDSFTMSAAEMAASGLPLVVSALQGLKETIDPDNSGFLFVPNDHRDLCDKLIRLLDDEQLRRLMSKAARDRALSKFTADRQVRDIARIIREVAAPSAGKRA